MTIDGQVCFHRCLFANPIKPPRCSTGSVQPVNGINKVVSAANNCFDLSCGLSLFLSLTEDTALLSVS